MSSRGRDFLGLLLIFLLAVFLRFYHLDRNPPALTWDEAAWGYNAYSLGLTGRDEFGRILPWNYLESFGDFKPPVYAYLTVLPVKLLGLNELATRFASAFFGALTVFFVFFLTQELLLGFKYARGVAFFSSLMLAISPWHLLLSRAAFEANVASFFLVAGVTFFLIGIRKISWLLLFSALSFSLSLQTFNTARVVAPLLVLGMGLFFVKKLAFKKTWVLISCLAGGLILLPVVRFYFSPQARLRFHEVNIFSNLSLIEKTNQQMANDNWVWWSRIIHNRRWAYFREYWRHYFDHFNPAFLFIKGDGNPKFSTQDVGQFYLWSLPFLLVGVLTLVKKKPGYWWLIFYWLVMGIIPAATSRETPHALRIEASLPTWQIIISFGLVEFLVWFKKKRLRRLFLPVVFFLLFSNFVYFQHDYWRHYPIGYAGEWQHGYRSAVKFIEKVEDQYDQIYFTDKLGRPYIFFLYYLQKNPQEFFKQVVVEREVYGFVKVKSFGKYHFYPSGELPRKEGKVLYVDQAKSIPDHANVVKEFPLPNGDKNLVAFEI